MQERKGRKLEPESLWEFQEVSLEKMFSKTSNEFSIVCIDENLRKSLKMENNLVKENLCQNPEEIPKKIGEKLNELTDKNPRKSMGKLREANQRERREKSMEEFQELSGKSFVGRISGAIFEAMPGRNI